MHVKKPPLKVPSKGTPLLVPPTSSLWREMLRLRFSYSFISVGVPKKERGRRTVTVQRAPRRRKASTQWGASCFPEGIIYDTVITTTVPCSIQHDTLHLGLGRLVPR